MALYGEPAEGTRLMAAGTNTTKNKRDDSAAECQVTPTPAVEDERHAERVDDYITRNRGALNASIERSRREVSEGKVSTKTFDELIAEGRSRNSGASK